MANVTTMLDTRSVPADKTALICPSRRETFSYGRLRSEMNRIALGLADTGLKRGDRVCIYLDSSPEYLISYLAAWRIGAVAVPANIVYRAKELVHIVNDSGASAIITSAEGAGVVERVRPDAPALSDVILCGGTCQDAILWDSFRPAPDSMRAVYCSPSDLCHIQYTAGTTGIPKGAMLTHGNWMAALDAERDALGMRMDDIYLGIYPMGHVGISWGLSILRAGGTFVIMERFEPDRYLSLAEEHSVTVLAAMPPVIHSLVQSPAGTERRLASVRVIISGGGQLLPSIWDAFDRRYHIPVANSYGLSETIVIGSGTTTLPDHPLLTRGFRSVGVAVGYTEVAVVDVDAPDRELPPGQDGEIALRGPSVAAGYWNMPDATAEAFRPDGWFLTGDIGHIDEEGILYITDRKKDMIIMSGWKIYPTEVENVLVQHPAIRDVAVFGIRDERKGEVPVAAVVLKPGQELDENGLISWCRDRLSPYKVPRNVQFVGELPRVHGWKLLRRTLMEQLSGNPPAE